MVSSCVVRGAGLRYGVTLVLVLGVGWALGTAACKQEPAPAPAPAPAQVEPAPATPSPATPAPVAQPADRGDSGDAVAIPDAIGLSSEAREAVAVLLASRHFGGWAVGVAGTPTPPVAAYRVVLREPHAAEAFAFVLEHGTPSGQLLALAGLWDLDRPGFDAAVGRFRDRKDTVPLETSGCMPGGDPEPVARIVERPDAVRLEGPDDDLSAWSTRNPGKPIEFDLVGGGYSAVLRPRSPAR